MPLNMIKDQERNGPAVLHEYHAGNYWPVLDFATEQGSGGRYPVKVFPTTVLAMRFMRANRSGCYIMQPFTA